MRSIVSFVIGIIVGTVSGTCAGPVEKVQFKAGKVFVSGNGTLAEAEEEIALPFQILVQTNGTFTVNDGKARKLAEGDILNKNGMLLRADGTITPVMDHVTMQRGKVVIVKDGQANDATEKVRLGDGSTISTDGYLTHARGTRRRLLDGEVFHLQGGVLPARDTVTMQEGRVTVQKDGSTFPVEPGRSITMNDGTKVLGDGTIVRFNGDRSKLREGETLVIEGVQTRRR